MTMPTGLQAFCSAIAKMCVRELRFTDTPNVSVFYLGLCSSIGAIFGCTAPKLWGVENTFRMPNAAVEWWLIVGTGVLKSVHILASANPTPYAH